MENGVSQLQDFLNTVAHVCLVGQQVVVLDCEFLWTVI